MTGLPTAFLIFDGTIKVMNIQAVMDAFARTGFPVQLAPIIGIVLLTCIVVYLIPRTSILGAILLTGYLGGATATQVRLQDPWFLLPVAMGILIWGGLYFRDGRLRDLIPLRSA